MAKLNDELLEQIHKNVSIVRLAQSKGVELTKQDKLWIGDCIFCKAEQSLKLNAFKNYWHCKECKSSGDVLDWAMKADGVSRHHAAELLRNELYLTTKQEPDVKPIKRATVKKLTGDIDASLSEAELLHQVMDFYHDTLKKSHEVLEFLESKKIASAELIDHFKLGYANRSLGYRLPEKNRKAGKEIRTKLQSMNVLRSTGHEHLNGSLVVPIIGLDGFHHDAYGRKIIRNLRKGTPMDLYLNSPVKGVFNEEAFVHNKSLVFCLNPIDALTFWYNGVHNVSVAFGVDGLTQDIKDAIQHYEIKKVTLAFPQGEAEGKILDECLAILTESGVECYRSIFPAGLTVNDFARQVDNPEEALAEKVRQVEWLSNGEVVNVPTQTVVASSADLPEVDKSEPININIPTDSRLPKFEGDVEANVSEHEIVLPIGDRRYRVRGFTKNLSFDQMKVNLLISRDKHFHVDTFDLYHARHRKSFVTQASAELSLKESTIKKDLGHVLLKLEDLQDEHINKTLTVNKELEAMTENDRAIALSFLKSTDLIDNIINDFETVGFVGERSNILLAYLSAVSRKLASPLAIVIQSASASGKSALMNAVLSMMPPEESMTFSAMTGQSLFYMEKLGLKHKILAIAEQEGVSTASYALKLLQSDGELRIASTGKELTSGRMVTQEYKVEGPVALFLTTTAIDIDEELMNRCVVLTVDESHQHTQAIHEMQRKRQTLDGMLLEQDKASVLNRHQNAQRLLKPYMVVNPYAEKLTFFSGKTRSRRDHMKYLSLIQSITLLRQHQKKIKSVNHNGVLLHYVETSIDDIALANELAKDVLDLSMGEVPRQTQKLLTVIQSMVESISGERSIDVADVRFTRKGIRLYCDWSDTQLKVHLRRLVELEYLLIHRGGRGQSYEYELLVANGMSNQMDCHLVDVDTLAN